MRVERFARENGVSEKEANGRTGRSRRREEKADACALTSLEKGSERAGKGGGGGKTGGERREE